MGKRYWKPGTVIYPLPAVMVSCGDIENESNIITIGWTGIINTNPPMTYISVRPARHSYGMIKEHMEFVINLTTKDLCFETDFAGVKSGRDFNKFEHLKLTPYKSKLVKAPSIYECPISLECKVFEIKELGSHHMFMAEIVSVTVDDEQFDENDKYLFNDLIPLAYSHGEYFALGDKVGKFGYSISKKEKNGVTKVDKKPERQADRQPKSENKTSTKNKPKKTKDKPKQKNNKKPKTKTGNNKGKSFRGK